MADKPMDRRRFFRHGLAELLRPLGRVTRPFEEMAKQFSELEKRGQPAPQPVPPRQPENTASYTPPASPDDGADPEYFLRPPGARDEQDFLNVCSRCGNCVNVCPVQAIRIDHSSHRAGGAPFIDPGVAACTMCDELACMTQCPSSALMLVPREEIDLGTAAWNESLCLRHAGDPCTMCVDHCPVGTLALEVLDNRIVVHEDHCTGCGSCQNNCPTYPKSIVVTPKAKRDATAS